MKILCVIGVILAIIIILILLLLFVPFPYTIDVNYIERRIDVKFKYLILDIVGFVDFALPIKYSFKMWNKILFDSSETKNSKKSKVDKKSADKNNFDEKVSDKIKSDIKPISISDTEFIKNKNLIKDTNDTKEAVKDLMIAAKNYEKELDKEKGKKNLKESVDNLLLKLNNLIPHDMIYVIKKLVDELFRLWDGIKPRKYSIDIKYGLGSPYMTGLLYSVAVPLMALTEGDINAAPDFKKTGFQSKLTIKGNIFLFIVGLCILRLLCDKRFKSIVLK